MRCFIGIALKFAAKVQKIFALNKIYYKKMQKNAKKFAYSKKKQYFCTLFRR